MLLHLKDTFMFTYEYILINQIGMNVVRCEIREEHSAFS